MVEAMQEPFTITQLDSDITATDALSTSASILTTIWSYNVPIGLGLIILPGHTFAMSLYDTGDAESPNTVQVRLVVLDSAKQEEKTIAGPFLYAVCKTFDDRDKMFRLNVAEPIKVYEKQYIDVQVSGDGTESADVLTEADHTWNYFELNIARVRQPL